MMRHLASWQLQGWHAPLPQVRVIAAASCFAAALLVLASATILAEEAAEAGSAAPSEKRATSAPPSVCATFRVRDQDQVWLVSTRHLGCPGGKAVPALQVWRYEKSCWRPSSDAEFHASDSAEVVTPIYIHGNQIDAGLAASYGLSFYFEFVGKLDAEPPARFVIWSWPSDKIKGPLRDVRAKADRSDEDAYYLGHFLAGMKPEVRVGLLGYSFGARIASGAMELLGGGSLFGQSLPPSPRPHVRLAMWAAAEHNYWYLPGQFHSQALAAGDAWFNTINSCDPVLSRYRWLDRCSNPAAAGHTGVYGRNLLPADINARIEEVNVSSIVGNEHNWRRYLYSRYIQDRTRDYLMWHELGFGTPQQTVATAAAN